MDEPRTRPSSPPHAESLGSAPGAAPGTIVVDADARQTTVRWIAYDAERFEEGRVDEAADVQALVDRWAVTWVDVDGLADAERIGRLAGALGLHPLALEDVFHLEQRPKVEDYGDGLFVVVRMAAEERGGETEQLSMFVRPGLVVTFQGGAPGDSLEPVRERLRAGKGRIRSCGADYLAYALVDVVVDRYFPVVEGYEEAIDALESEALEVPAKDLPERIHGMKTEILALRRVLRPLRDAVAALQRGEAELLAANTRLHLRDTLDHVDRLLDAVEGYREVAAGLLEVFLTSVNNRMNEVMKVLTIIATIFIPLTFIAGVYGMNFHNMPELSWPWGYPLIMGAMAAIGLSLTAYFRRRGWLGEPKGTREGGRERNREREG